MKIKTFFILAIFALVLVACSPAPLTLQGLVSLPTELQQAISIAVTLVVGWLFVQIGNTLPWVREKFGQYQDEIAFAVSGVIVSTLQNLLDQIPATWSDSGNIALALIVSVLTALGVFRLLGKRGVPSFRVE